MEAGVERTLGALVAAGPFTDTGAAEWIWQSLALGAPVDRRFEGLFPKRMPNLPG